MATLTGYSMPIDMLYPYPNYGTLFSVTSTYIGYEVDGEIIEFRGSGFAFDPFTGDPVAGTISRLDFWDADLNPIATVTGFAVPLTTLWSYYLADNWLGFAKLVGAGGDSIVGGAGDDTLAGFAGNDTIRGNGGDDLLIGNDGSDYLDGGSGDDFLFGDITLVEGVGFGNDTLDGGDGIDALDGEEGNDSLVGGNGTDFFLDRQGNNTINGGAQDDFIGVFVPPGGTSVATGGTGQDVYFSLGEEADLFTGWGTFNVTDFQAGTGGDYLLLLDLIFTSLDYGFFGSNPLDPSQGFLRLTQSGPDTLLQWDVDGAAGGLFPLRTVITLQNVNASSLTSENFFGLFLTGGDGDDNLVGNSQYDLISSLAGNDTLDGAGGRDTLEGGSGNDLYYVDDAKDVVVETSNTPAPVLASAADDLAGPALDEASLEGVTDTVIAAVTYSLENVKFVENLTLAAGSAAATGTGNELNNALTGNASNNTLSGLAGNDTLSGSAGNDTLDGGAGVDTAAYSNARAGYTVTKTASGHTVSGPEGNDTLSNIERLKFSDKSLAVDMGASEAGGKTALLLGACLGANGLNDKTIVGGILGYFDGGYTLTDAATALVDAGIVAQLAGGADNKHFVDWMALNLVDALPDASTEAVLIDFITSGQFTQATFLATLAAHQINQDHIGLVGLQQNGMEYL